MFRRFYVGLRQLLSEGERTPSVGLLRVPARTYTRSSESNWLRHDPIANTPRHTAQAEAGFTLVELLIVMALFAALAGLIGINLMKPQSTASVVAAADVLVSDLRAQQARAMAGESVSGTAPVAQGLRFTDNSGDYIQFKGASYDAGDADNFNQQIDEPIELSTSFPGDVVVFAPRSGEVAGWTSGQSTITIHNKSSNESKTITLNRYGVPTVN